MATLDEIYAELVRIADLPPPRTKPIKLTRQQLDSIPRAAAPAQPWLAGQLAPLAGVPVELVDTVYESTPFTEAFEARLRAGIRAGVGTFRQEV